MVSAKLLTTYLQTAVADVSYFMVFFGLVWLTGGLAFIWQAQKRERLGYRTQGEIVDVVGEWGGNSSRLTRSYYPVVRIKTAEGVTVERKMDIGTSPSLWRRGKMMTVVYFDDKIHPTGWGWTLFYGLFAVVGFGILIYQLLAFYS